MLLGQAFEPVDHPLPAAHIVGIGELLWLTRADGISQQHRTVVQITSNHDNLSHGSALAWELKNCDLTTPNECAEPPLKLNPRIVSPRSKRFVRGANNDSRIHDDGRGFVSRSLPLLFGPCTGLLPVRDSYLAKNVLYVFLYRFVTDVERLGNVLIGHA